MSRGGARALRITGAAVLVAFLGGCTSTKMVQRDGCWVRRTEKRVLGTVAEEVGPCARPATPMVENDPLTRLVQECVTRADYRWQMRALAAWDRREEWPEQLSESSVLQQCIDESARGVMAETAALRERNAALQQRIADLEKDHAAALEKNEAERRELVRRTDEERTDIVRRTDEQRKELLALQTRLGEHLGEAAKKIQPIPQPAPAIATATASSEGRSRSEQAEAQGQPATLAVVTTPGSAATAPVCVVPPAAPARADTAKQSTTRQARTPTRATTQRKASTANLPACDPTKTPEQAKAAGAATTGASSPASQVPRSAAISEQPVPAAARVTAGAVPSASPQMTQAPPAGEANAIEKSADEKSAGEKSASKHATPTAATTP